MKKLLALVLALVMSMSLVTISNAAFKDADKITADHEEAVEVMSAIGVLVGDEKQNFNAKDNLTRAQAAKIISYLLLGNKTAEALAGSGKFTDVAKTSWFAGFVDYCASTGVVNGVGDGKFDPNGQLTGYQFAKMLLGALGYDATIQGFTGTDWQINVSKIANLVGLFEGLNIKGTDVLNREQAAQMAFNTLKSPLVEYNNKGGNVTINGAVIGISASDYEYVTTTIAKEQTISKQYLSNTNKGIYTVEFAERYYPDLTLTADEDDFGRPARTWAYNKETVGTFVNYDQLVAEYTVKVTGKTMYTDIGYKNINDYATYVFEDGVAVKSFDADSVLTKNNDNELLKGIKNTTGTGKGVLTQVFVNDTDEVITIVVIHTYLAKAIADYNDKKEYLSVEVYGGPTDTKVLLEDAESITDVKSDDYLLVNVADGEIVAVAKAESVTDAKITKYSLDGTKLDTVTAAGTSYDTSKDFALTVPQLTEYHRDALVDYTYNLYIDQYGYVIGVKEFSGDAHYLFLVGYDKTTSNLANKTATANVIFADGTMKNVEVKYNDTNDNIKDFHKNSANKYEKDYPVLNADGLPSYNRWFKYTEKNGVYTLDPVEKQVLVNSAVAKEINVQNVRLVCSVTGCGNKAWGNDDSVYITVEAKSDATDNGAAITKVKGVYTGVQNVSLKPDTKAVGQISRSVFAVYDDHGYIIAAIVIGSEGSDSNSYAYAVKGAQNEFVLGDDDNYYWDFKAVYQGEYKTLTVKTEYVSVIDKLKSVVDKDALGKPALLDLSFDADGYVTDVKVLKDSDNAVYGKTELETATDIDPKKFDVYMFEAMDAKLTAMGRTLYSNAKNDVGLTLVSGAPVVVLQKDADGDYSVEEYSTIKQALDAVENSNEFTGVIAAVLNEKGTAEYLVLSSADQLTDNKKDDDKKVSKVDTLYAYAGTNSIKLNVGMTQAVNSETKVDVTVKVLNGGTWVDVDTYTVVIAKDAKLGTALTVDGLAAGQYKVVCGDLSKTVAVQ